MLFINQAEMLFIKSIDPRSIRDNSQSRKKNINSTPHHRETGVLTTTTGVVLINTPPVVISTPLCGGGGGGISMYSSVLLNTFGYLVVFIHHHATVGTYFLYKLGHSTIIVII